MRRRAATSVITREESATDELPERDWLFPAILATLLAGSAISFALAYAGGHIVQHQELKISAEHSCASRGSRGAHGAEGARAERE